MKLPIAVLALLLIGAAACLVPVQPYQDFQVLFHADMGLLRGIALYDQPGQVEMIARIAGVTPGQVYVLPFPYPPWYALSTMWLALLPVTTAVRVWLGLNLVMLVGSVALMTSDETPLKRAALLLGAIFWLPVLGGLLVGQYGFPVLLGAVLMVHSIQHEKPALIALAAVLLSFKPHLGAVLVLLTLVHLLIRGDRSARKGLWGMIAAGGILLGLGFLASPRWPLEYVHSLMSFQGVHGVPQCTQCVSVPVLLSRVMGGGLSLAVWIALVCALIASAWLIARWKLVAAHAMGLVSMGALVTLLVSPYLLNYDYLLLLVPLMAVASKARSLLEWLLLGLAYVLPAAALALWGPNGNAILIVSTCIVFILTFLHLGGAGEGVVRQSA